MRVDDLSHVAARFTHALQMLAELVPYTDDPELPRVVQIACLEGWFTNYRLLIEFLLLKPASNCAAARSFLSEWSPEKDSHVAKSLLPDYGWASEDVAHIGLPRKYEPMKNVAPEALHARAERLLDLADEFVTGLERTHHDLVHMISIGVTQARESLGPAGRN